MIKVLIVDDEVMFRIGVKSCIKWNNYGYELIGEAENGEQALQIIKTKKPDIVFTDIKMPVMDGLELTKAIVRDYPGIIVVILSCYNDFEYVKEALKLGARDYILKLSMKPDDLVELLLKFKEMIVRQKLEKEQEDAIRQEFNVNINKLKEEFLKRILFEKNNLAPVEFDKKAEVLGLRIRYNSNFVILIMIDDYLNALEVIKDERLFEFAFINIANEITNKYAAGEVIRIKDRLFACIASIENCSKGESSNIIAKIIRDINLSTKKYLNYTISAGSSSNSGNINEIHKLYSEASAALDKGFYYGNEYFGYYAERCKNVDLNYSIDLETEGKLMHALETNNIKEVIELLHLIFKCFNDDYPPEHVRAVAKEIIYIFNRSLKNYGGNLFNIFNENPMNIINNANTMRTIQSWFEGFAESVVHKINELKGNYFRGEIIKVVDYIKANMHKSISLKDAARIANMSEKYFCVLFKKETGKNFVDYVNDEKVNRAKELLKNPDIKIYEVAQLAGFTNEGYFSKIFKKYSGYTPQEYKKNFFSN